MRLLQDEVPTEQDRQLSSMGFEPLDSADHDDPTWGSDPLEILAAREERSRTSLIHMAVDHDD